MKYADEALLSAPATGAIIKLGLQELNKHKERSNKLNNSNVVVNEKTK